MSSRQRVRRRDRRGGFAPTDVTTPAVSATGSSNVDAFGWQPLDPADAEEFRAAVAQFGSTEYAAMAQSGDPDGVLTVTFHGGATYQYSPVPVSVFVDMLNAGSRGRFVWNVLRQYPYIGPL